MFGKKSFAAFPQLKNEKTTKRFGISVQTKLALLSGLVLFPATWFWSSVILRLGLGTDYFFDVYFENLSDTFAGNVILILAVIFLPGLAIGINGIAYLERKEKPALVTLIIGAILLAVGFFAVIKRE